MITKVRNMYFIDNSKDTLGDYATGLVIELDDGRFLKALTTDVIKPFEEIEHNTNSDKCWCDPRIEVLENGNKVIVHKE